MKNKNIITFLLMTIMIVMSIFLVKQAPDFEEVKVIRIVDGDTIIVENNRRIRILGIDAPERNEQGFEASKYLLENIILEKYVNLFCVDYDKWKRELCWVYFDNQDISEIMKK